MAKGDKVNPHAKYSQRRPEPVREETKKPVGKTADKPKENGGE